MIREKIANGGINTTLKLVQYIAMAWAARLSRRWSPRKFNILKPPPRRFSKVSKAMVETQVEYISDSSVIDVVTRVANWTHSVILIQSVTFQIEEYTSKFARTLTLNSVATRHI